MENKIKLYTCKSGLNLMDNGESFYAWAKEGHSVNFSGKDYAIIVNRDLVGYCEEDDDYYVKRNSGAMILSDWIKNNTHDSEEFVCGHHSEEINVNSLKITSNYAESWAITKKNYEADNNIAPFYIEVSNHLSNEYLGGCDCNYTSMTIEEAEKLVAFLQNKIKYIKGE